MGVTTRQTGLNIASQWGLHITNVVVNLFLIRYVIGKVGAEHYGGWTTIVSVIGYLSILTAGMSLTMQHYVARFEARQEQTSLISVYNSSYVIYGIAAVIALLVCLWDTFEKQTKVLTYLGEYGIVHKMSLAV
jgi:O-antigen/teichoic acid export membrane protein